MATPISGKNIMLYYKDTSVDPAVDIPFACSTNCTFQVQVAQLDVTSQTSAWYKEFKNDIASWTIGCEGLVIINGWNYTNMLQVQQDRTPIAVELVIDNGEDGLTVLTGTCNLTSLQINAPYKDLATYSVSLQGSGAYGISGTHAASGGIIIKGGLVYYKHYDPAGGETTITWTDMIGKDCVYVSRGGVNSKQIITTGTPTSEQVKWNSVTGVLTFGRALNSQDFVNALFS